MTAYMMPLDLRQRAFLECIRWADVVCPHLLVVVDIDFKNFDMAILGEDSSIEAFAEKVRNLFFSAEEKINERDANIYA